MIKPPTKNEVADDLRALGVIKQPAFREGIVIGYFRKLIREAGELVSQSDVARAAGITRHEMRCSVERLVNSGELIRHPCSMYYPKAKK